MNTVKKFFSIVTNQHWGPTTVISAVVTLVGAIAGGVITITNPGTLPFHTYIQDLGIFAGGNGLVAIGRGLHLGGVLSALGVTPAVANSALVAAGKIDAVIPGPLGQDVKAVVGDAEAILTPDPAPQPSGAVQTPAA